MERDKQRVLVLGATGGSGRAAVEWLLAAGHEVTAFRRRAGDPGSDPAGLKVFVGDALDPRDVDRAVRGQDAVIVTLGISENPFAVRLRGPRHTPMDVRSRGTRHVIDAMKRHGVHRLVVQTSYGVGETRARLRPVDRAFFTLVLKPQIDDTEIQERDVRQSDLEWVLVQPVHLTDDTDDAPPMVSPEGDTGRMQVSRRSVGRFLAETVISPEHVRRTVALSGVR